MTLGDIIAQSSNIGIAKVADCVGQGDARDVPGAVRLRRDDGARVPGRGRRACVPALSDWSDVTLATISYGQGVAVTPLQMATVYATVANGGVWVQPRLVRGTVDGAGTFSAAPASPTDASLSAADRDDR